MTDALIAHLERVRQRLEKEKGKFSFFALVRRSDSSDLDLLVSAPWLTEEKMRGLAQVVQRVYSDDIPKDWWTRIAHIFTLNESDADNRALMAAIGPARQLRILDWPRVPGPAIEQAWVLWNDPRPDEDRDVIVHYFDEVDASTGIHRDRWLVFQGPDRRGEARTSDEAIAMARRLSAETGRPAWLLDENGYPMKWIGQPNQPHPEDVVMYYINFERPLPLRGWYVVRAGREEFSETDDERAVRRACAIARQHQVRCFRVRDTEPEEINCESVH
jgi:hypothetical protein